MKMPSPMKGAGRFAKVPTAEIQRSQFDRSHGYKTTFDAGFLVPIYLDEALPGDTFNLKLNAFARLTTPIKPIMDNLWLDTFFFAVPYRLVWTNWEKFNGAQDDPGDSTSFTIPQMTVPASGYYSGGQCIQDYLGLPVDVVPGSPAWSHSALPTRAYYLIYNEWFRDENLQDSVSHVGVSGAAFVKGDGPDVSGTGGCPVLRRGKRHDYFTSCLPWPQKGTAVSLPLGTTAPVVGTGDPSFINALSGVSSLHAKTASTTADVNLNTAGSAWGAGEALTWDNPQLETDLSSATAATINSLREAFQIQRLLERDARGGTRYTEIIKSHFGVTSPDARLQRSEYLGGGSTPIIISPIAQNSANTSQPTPQGNLAGIGTAQINGHGFVKSFTEHCLLIGIASVRADLSYFQGVERHWSRSTRYDFYWPAFAHLGEQAVLNKEIYLQGNSSDDGVFGYQERYAEYRYKPSRITGKFRPNVSGTLDIWHLAQDFTALPTLNSTFIQETPPVDRVVAVTSEPEIYYDSFIELKCARPMPMYSVPGLIDHF